LLNKLHVYLHLWVNFLVRTNLALGGKQLEGAKRVGQNEHSHYRYDEVLEKEVSTPSKEVIGDDTSNKILDDPKKISLKPYVLPLPFPQRIAKAKLDQQFGKFLKVLQKLYINIPFTDALSQMSSYAKILKDILCNKRKQEEHKTVAFTEECSAAIQNKLPAKLRISIAFLSLV